jgi:peptidoglycan hydrolase CwlO-like protein
MWEVSRAFLLASLLGLCLLPVVYGQSSPTSTESEIQLQIENLESLETDIQNLNLTISALEQQKQNLEDLITQGESLTAEQEKKLKELDEQLVSYKSRVEVLQKRLESLLKLLKKLRDELIGWKTISTVLGITTLIGFSLVYFCNRK